MGGKATDLVGPRPSLGGSVRDSNNGGEGAEGKREKRGASADRYLNRAVKNPPLPRNARGVPHGRCRWVERLELLHQLIDPLLVVRLWTRQPELSILDHC